MLSNAVKSKKSWNACGYVRLSHEDAEREESNSVTGQKELIRDYFRRHPELMECGMRVDDGFSGSSFERPAFQAMMSDVKAGKIDCIVVKDDCVILELNSESPENTGLCDVSSVF